MLHFFKYLIYFLILLSIILFYFLFTPLGKTNIYNMLGYALSQKAGVTLEVKSLDIQDYPQVRVVLQIEHKAELTLWGHLDDALVDMDYTMTSQCIATEHCKLDDTIDIEGHIQGPYTKLSIYGEGKALDGQVHYSLVKYPEKAEHIDAKLKDCNATKLFRLLGQTALIKGKANATVHFSLMNETQKQGYIVYDVKDENFRGIPLSLHTKVNINDDEHTFIANIDSDNLKLNITKGKYNQKTKKASAFYVLDVQNLSKLEHLLGYKYRGDIYAMGEITYDKTIQVTGLSKSFGGMTDFHFQDNILTLTLEDVHLHEILHLFPFPPMIKANAKGSIVYNFNAASMKVRTTLKQAKFVHSKLVDVIYKKSGANMLKETFNDASLDLDYHHNVIIGNLKLANPHSHVYLTSAKIDTQKSTINAYFDFQMQAQEFSGKVFGDLENPHVNLNMQKLIRYQMDKQVDKMIGRSNRKMMEKMPMAPVAKDVAADMGASFMKVFF